MITTLAVRGYRSLREVIVPLGQVTVVTGPNGSGKSNLYRALRLLASVGSGRLIGTLAREGGLGSALWAGPETPGAQGTVRRRPVSVELGIGGDDLGYLVDLGLPAPPTSGPPGPFARDPEIKREQVFAGAVPRPSALLIDRLRARVRIRDDEWTTSDQGLAPWESIVTDLADGSSAPELLALRRTLSGWRFHDHVRVDADAPVRRPQLGTRTPVLADDGRDLAAVWATIVDAGRGDLLDAEVSRAFPGCRVSVDAEGGMFTLRMTRPGLLRPLDAAELSDGTLRYLLLCAALLTPNPGALLVLNEPESSLHPELLPRLGELIATSGESAQVVVVTHADRLVEALSAAGATSVRLRGGDETRVEGQGLLDAPRWDWGTR